MNEILVDASYLVALGYPRDRNHSSAKVFAAQHSTGLLIPDVVLVEALYNLQRLGGIAAAATQFVPLLLPDFVRAIGVMRQYRDSELDFVDCCLTAIAERLNITGICTFDRRDFSMIRPKHADYFALLP